MTEFSPAVPDDDVMLEAVQGMDLFGKCVKTFIYILRYNLNLPSAHCAVACAVQ
jgi:hypothetical protein